MTPYNVYPDYLQKKVFGYGAMWAAMLRMVMAVTGKGYHKSSMARTGKGTDRRKDKLARPNERKCFRQYRVRYV